MSRRLGNGLKGADGLLSEPLQTRLLTGFLLAFTLTACASTQEVMKQEPAKIKEFDQRADLLSKCTFAALSAQERGYAFRVLHERSEIIIEAQIANAAETPGQYVQFQVQFDDRGSSKTAVTVRSLKTIWGGYVYPETIWPLIAECASH
jgi:hypothetical protein